MRRSIATITFGTLIALAGCKQGDDDKGGAATKSGEPDKPGPKDPGTPAGTDPATPGDPQPAGSTDTMSTDTSARPDPGVEGGGIDRDADEGAAAVVAAVDGTVEVRRLGEVELVAAAAGTELFAGDQLRTADRATATVTLADETVVEIAEVSTVAIASRDASADPASGAAVLAGLARFTVSDRAPGEGAFRVYTPSGVVMTTGTVYVVGVAASGVVRVGVEAGAIEVVGATAIDAEPVAVAAGRTVVLSADGEVAAPVEWKQDDWGAWRAEADAAVTVGAAIEAHAAALARYEHELAAAYRELERNAEAFATFEAQAATHAEAQATAEYEVAAPDGAATIEASFGLAGAAEAITWAYAGRATLAAEIYARHPDEVRVQYEASVAPHVDAAVLWPKRFEVTATAFLEPLRVQYYVHHPRGRAHADLVGVAVPEFYAQVAVREPEPAQVRARANVRVYARPPTVMVRAQARPVWIAAPQPGWKVKVKARPAKARARAAWYVRPPQAPASILVGTDVKVRVQPTVVVKAREPRAKIRGQFRVQPATTRIVVRAPDLDAAAKARMKVKIKNGVVVRDHRAGGAVDVKVREVGGVDVKVRDHRDVGGKVDLKAGAGGAVDVKVRDHRDGAGKVDVKVRDHRDKAGDGKTKVRVREPKDKAGADAKAKGEVDVKVKAKGGVKIGP
jgi:hypothetical protein